MDNNKLIGLRIKEARIERHLSQEELGKRLGLNKSTIQRYEVGKIEKLKLPVIQAIALELEVNPDWLILKSDSQISNNKSNLLIKYDLRPIDRVKIPMLGDVACGKPIFVNEDRESYVESGVEIKADFCIKAKGDSMINARINDGDIVFCRKQSAVDNGEIAVVIIGDEATLKRVYYYPESQKLVLQAENPAYEPFVYVGEELEQVYILGKAIAFQSDIK